MAKLSFCPRCYDQRPNTCPVCKPMQISKKKNRLKFLESLEASATKFNMGRPYEQEIIVLRQEVKD